MASIQARKKKHESKMARKRAVKAARREKYKSLAGTSKKKKRQMGTGKRSPYKHAHIMSDCGNVGCLKCNPRRLAMSA